MGQKGKGKIWELSRPGGAEMKKPKRLLSTTVPGARLPLTTLVPQLPAPAPLLASLKPFTATGRKIYWSLHPLWTPNTISTKLLVY